MRIIIRIANLCILTKQLLGGRNMAFFKRKRKGTINASVKVADVSVVTSMIISSHNDGTGGGPMCVTMYFLARHEDGEYYELFSGKKLEKESQNDSSTKSLDTPYVLKAEPLKNYLKDEKIDIQSLFDFITLLNVEKRFS
jgi:hypothetical protein